MRFFLLCVATGSFTAAASESLELRDILERIAVTPPSRVRYTEVRHNAMLKEPLLQSGYLEYIDRGHLRKVVEEPYQEAFVVDGDNVIVERDGETKTLPIRRSKALQAMLSGIAGILAGEVDSLSTVFNVELGGIDDDWILTLTPRSKRVAKQLTAMRVAGNLRRVTVIRFELGDGEWHAMTLQPQSPQP